MRPVNLCWLSIQVCSVLNIAFLSFFKSSCWSSGQSLLCLHVFLYFSCMALRKCCFLCQNNSDIQIHILCIKVEFTEEQCSLTKSRYWESFSWYIPSFFLILIANWFLNLHWNFNTEGALQATPKYNSSILEDMFLEDNFEFVKRTFMGWKELGEALILLKVRQYGDCDSVCVAPRYWDRMSRFCVILQVWARQRSSIYAHDCLSGFLIAIIMAYLASKSSKNRINKSVNVIQILRITLDFIGTWLSYICAL